MFFIGKRQKRLSYCDNYFSFRMAGFGVADRFGGFA